MPSAQGALQYGIWTECSRSRIDPDPRDANPGMLRSMKTYGQFCPVAQALEVLAERWTLLVVRELLMGSTRFNDIRRGVPLISRTLLSQRLQTLSDEGLVERIDGPSGPEYRPTPSALELRPIIESIGVWGKKHAGRDLREEHLDPDLLMWDLQRRVAFDRLPTKRTVVFFRLQDRRTGERRYWLHLERPEADLCLTSEGFEPDLTVESDVRTMTEVWMGHRAMKQAIREQAVRLQGESTLKRDFPSWLELSTFAGA